RFRAVMARFPPNALSVLADPNFTGTLARFERGDLVQRVAISDPPVYREYTVPQPTAIWRPTNAPLLVVVGGSDEYDTVARMSLDRGARPGTLLPIWWQDTADRHHNELLCCAPAVVVEDGLLCYRAV